MAAVQSETVTMEPPKWLWVAWLALGILTSAAGVWLLFSREGRLWLLLVLLSVSLFLNGISELAQASSRRRPVWGYVLGGLFLVGGVVVLVYPRGSLWGLAAAIGVILITVGVFQTAGAVVERDILVHWKLLATLGALTVVTGVLALVWPQATVLVLAFILGIRVLLFGLLQIAAALTLRSLMKAPPSA